MRVPSNDGSAVDGFRSGLKRVVVLLTSLAVVASMLVAVVVGLEVSGAPIAGAATVTQPATFTGGTGCNSYETATAPTGTTSATVSISGGGGGAATMPGAVTARWWVAHTRSARERAFP